MITATNPTTGEKVAYIAGKWVPIPGTGTPQPKAEPPPEDAGPGFVSAFTDNLVEAAGKQNIEALGGAAEATGVLAGKELTGRRFGRMANDLAASVDPEGEPFQPASLSDVVQNPGASLGYALGQATGSTLPSLAAGVAGGAAGAVAGGPIGATIGTALSAAGASYITQFGQNYRTFIDQGADADTAAKAAAAVALPQAILDTYGLGKALSPFRSIGARLLGQAGEKAAGNVAARVAKGAVKGAVSEGLTEAAQQGLQEAASSQIAPLYDPEGLAGRLAANAAVGAVGGGAFGTVGGALDRPTPPVTRPAQQDQQQPAAAPDQRAAIAALPDEQARAVIREQMGVNGIKANAILKEMRAAQPEPVKEASAPAPQKVAPNSANYDPNGRGQSQAIAETAKANALAMLKGAWVPIRETEDPNAPIVGYVNEQTGEQRTVEQHRTATDSPLSGLEPQVPTPEQIVAQRAATAESAEPAAEWLSGVALKVGNEVFAGGSHGDAIDQALSRGVPEAAINQALESDPAATSRFVTSSGRVVDLAEAQAIAEKQGQLTGDKADPATGTSVAFNFRPPPAWGETAPPPLLLRRVAEKRPQRAAVVQEAEPQQEQVDGGNAVAVDDGSRADLAPGPAGAVPDLAPTAASPDGLRDPLPAAAPVVDAQPPQPQGEAPGGAAGAEPQPVADGAREPDAPAAVVEAPAPVLEAGRVEAGTTGGAQAPAPVAFTPNAIDSEDGRPVAVAEAGNVRSVRYEDGTLRQERAKPTERYRPLTAPETPDAPQAPAPEATDAPAAGVGAVAQETGAPRGETDAAESLTLVKQGEEPARFAPKGAVAKVYNLTDPAGGIRATMEAIVSGDTARISSIVSMANPPDFIKNRGTLGAAALRAIAAGIAADNPDVRYLTGERVSGARVGGAHVQGGQGVEAKVDLRKLLRQRAPDLQASPATGEAGVAGGGGVDPDTLARALTGVRRGTRKETLIREGLVGGGLSYSRDRGVWYQNGKPGEYTTAADAVDGLPTKAEQAQAEAKRKADYDRGMANAEAIRKQAEALAAKEAAAPNGIARNKARKEAEAKVEALGFQKDGDDRYRRWTDAGLPVVLDHEGADFWRLMVNGPAFQRKYNSLADAVAGHDAAMAEFEEVGKAARAKADAEQAERDKLSRIREEAARRNKEPEPVKPAAPVKLGEAVTLNSTPDKNWRPKSATDARNAVLRQIEEAKKLPASAWSAKANEFRRKREEQYGKEKATRGYPEREKEAVADFRTGWSQRIYGGDPISAGQKAGYNEADRFLADNPLPNAPTTVRILAFNQDGARTRFEVNLDPEALEKFAKNWQQIPSKSLGTYKRQVKAAADKKRVLVAEDELQSAAETLAANADTMAADEAVERAVEDAALNLESELAAAAGDEAYNPVAADPDGTGEADAGGQAAQAGDLAEGDRRGAANEGAAAGDEPRKARRKLGRAKLQTAPEPDRAPTVAETVRLAANVIAGNLPDAEAARMRDEIAAELRPLLKRLAGDRANLKVFDAIRAEGGTSVAGAQVRDLIAVAMLDGDRVRPREAMEATVRHEAVHFMRASGLIPEPAWNALEAKAGQWRKALGIDSDPFYAGLSESAKNEEAIAEAFSRYKRGSLKVAGAPLAGFRAIGRFLDALRGLIARVLGIPKLPRPADVFDALERGDYLASEDADAVSGQPMADRLRRDAVLLRQLGDTDAFRKQGLRGLDGPSRRLVMQRMLALAHDPKVFQAVVGAVPVDVVDMLAAKQLTPERLFQDPSVFENLFSANSDSSIAAGVEPAVRAFRVVARAAAKALGADEPVAGPEVGATTRASSDRGRSGGVIAGPGAESPPASNLGGNASEGRAASDADTLDRRLRLADAKASGAAEDLSARADFAGPSLDGATADKTGMARHEDIIAELAKPYNGLAKMQTTTLGRGAMLRDMDQGALVDDLTEQNVGLLTRVMGPNMRGRAGAYLDRARRLFQDRMIYVRRTQEEAERLMGRPVGEDEDAYLAEELFHGKVGEQKFRQDKDFREPIIQAMHDSGLTLAEVDDYLTARHAAERNQAVSEINPKFPDGGSGMTNAEAERILAGFNPEKRAALDTIGELVDQMMARRLAQMVDSGIISAAEADAYRSKYRHYVPLRGVPADPNEEAMKPTQGRGFMGSRKREKRAMGRGSRAADVLATAFTLADEAIVRGEKNRVAQALLNLAMAAPDPSVWEVNPVEREAYMAKLPDGRQQVRYRYRPHYSGADTVSVRVDGREFRIQLKDPDLLRAFANLGGGELNVMLQGLSHVTRTLSKLNTMWSPEFIVANAFMDFQSGLINLGQEDQKGLRREVAGNWLNAYRGAVHYLRNGTTDTEWSRYAQEFRENGGQTAFNDLVDKDAQAKKLEDAVRELESRNASRARRALRTIGQTIEQWNTGVDNAVRLSTYAALRRRGYSPARSASVAKNLTVNFNRKGEAGPALNALFAFYNAAIQGTAVLAGAIYRSRKVQAMVAGIVVAGAMQEILGGMFDPPDDDPDQLGLSAYDRIPEWQKARNIIIPTGSEPGDYLMIRMPYGYNFFHNLGRLTAAFLRGAPEADGKPVGLGKTIAKLGSNFAEAMIPPGLGSLGVPTVAEPFVDIWKNEDFFGKPIAPTKFPGDEKPDSQTYYPNVNPAAREVAGFLNRVTGGDEFRPGLVDVSPESIMHVLTTYAGAAGALAVNTISNVYRAGAEAMGANAENPSLDLGDVPFARKVMGTASPWQARDITYQRIGEIEILADEAKANPEARRENRRLLALTDDARKLRKEMSTLRKERRRILADEALPTRDRRARTDRLDAKEREAMAAFNRRYIRALQPASGAAAP